MIAKKQSTPIHFPAVPVDAVTNIRMGKHQKLVSQILSDVEMLDATSALKVDFVRLGVKKPDLRSAIHRAAKKRNMELITTSDDRHLYVFRRSILQTRVHGSA